MIGLERGTVHLYPHEKEWEEEAQRTIERLHELFGDVAKDIQHVGSTSIKSIMAKPIIDIAVAVDNFDDVMLLREKFEQNGFYYRTHHDTDLPNQILIARGNYYEGTGNLQTHFVHVVLSGSMEWIDYINFRDYLNENQSVAKEYENLKLSLAESFDHIDSGRKKYLEGKHDFIVHTLRKALVASYLGKTVSIKIDRPIGTVHPKHDDIVYPINYGYIPGVIGGDGEELDVYLLGVDTPVSEFTARVIGIVHRADDVEDKLVAAPCGMIFDKDDISRMVHFQEQFYQTKIETI